MFCWKLLNKAVPVDTQVQNSGVYFASSCVCCRDSHSIEDEDHLFIGGEIAKYLWSVFSTLLHPHWLDNSHICS